jgi:hypothetical protein
MTKRTEPWSDPVPTVTKESLAIKIGKLFGSALMLLLLFCMFAGLLGLAVLSAKWLWGLL